MASGRAAASNNITPFPHTGPVMMSDTNSIQKTTASTLAELTPTMAYGVMIRLRDWHLSSSG